MAIDPDMDHVKTNHGLGLRSRETLAFGLVLAALIAGFFHESLVGGRILSPVDVLLVEASFNGPEGLDYEPANRLLMDPVIQFQPWLEFNRNQIRRGRLPLWNPFAGCGAPHLANGQSAVFDPFNFIAYAWTVPDALGWMAAGRLWVAGLGMFLLAGSWRFGTWGRWFAGLVFPFSGFLVAWLLYPVTPVAIWMPWLFLVSDRALRHATAGSIAAVAIVTALILFGGHVQTGAHVLLSVGLFVLWRIYCRRAKPFIAWGILTWTCGIVLGLGLAAIQIVPLADYLTKSPVWSDRQHDLVPWWKLSKPRILDILCTPLPYLYGSQRRGHPNLARAVGVHNLNESSGGFVGLPTLILLVPLGWKVMRSKRGANPDEQSIDPDVVPFLLGLAAVGFLGAFRLPPIDNLLRLLPVLNVTDNRRLGLWMAFAFTLIGGVGLDGLQAGVRVGKGCAWAMILGTATLFVASGAILVSEPELRRRAEVHYRQAAERNSEANPEVYSRRADRRLRATVDFLPRYYAETGCGLLVLVGLMAIAKRRPTPGFWIPASILVLTLADLGRFGLGLNPAIDRAIQSFEPPVISSLRQVLKLGQRAIGIGEELPPNVLMRFGIGDPRNYDSVELSRNLAWLAPLFNDAASPAEAMSSRRTIDWRGVARARDRLEAAGVAAVVGATSPPTGMFETVDKLDKVWVVRLDPKPWATWNSAQSSANFERDPGRIQIPINADRAGSLIVRESWDEGWRARIDGRPTIITPHQNTFLEIAIPKGSHQVNLEYAPASVMLGAAVSLAAATAIVAILGLTRIRRYLIPG